MDGDWNLEHLEGRIERLLKEHSNVEKNDRKHAHAVLGT